MKEPRLDGPQLSRPRSLAPSMFLFRRGAPCLQCELRFLLIESFARSTLNNAVFLKVLSFGGPLCRLSKRQRVGTRWKPQRGGRVVRRAPHRFGDVRLARDGGVLLPQ